MSLQEHNIENPFNTDVDFHSLPLRTKVVILNYLCEFREYLEYCPWTVHNLITLPNFLGLDSADVDPITSKYESDSLRVKPLGFDSNHSTYWYFYGMSYRFPA